MKGWEIAILVVGAILYAALWFWAWRVFSRWLRETYTKGKQANREIEAFGGNVRDVVWRRWRLRESWWREEHRPVAENTMAFQIEVLSVSLQALLGTVLDAWLNGFVRLLRKVGVKL